MTKNRFSVFIFFAVAVWGMFSCKTAQSFGEAEVIRYGDFKHVDEPLVTPPLYVILKSTDQLNMLSEIRGVKIFDDRIYVLDANPRPYKIVEFDIEGNPLRVFLKQGRGPGEYMQITDFDVDADGTLYVIDGQSDRLLTYAADFTFLTSVEVPVEVDLLKRLDNGKYVVQYSSWASAQADGAQVATVDSNLLNPEPTISYGVTDDNFMLGNSHFVSSRHGIFYHREISDSVYLLSPIDGKILKRWKFDFGSNAVPESDKADVESCLDHFNHYITPVEFTIITDSHIYGTMYVRRHRQAYVADRAKNEISYLPVEYGEMIGAGNGLIISRLNISALVDGAKYPDDVAAALAAGDSVLALLPIE